MRTLVRDNALYALMTKHLNNHYLSIHLSQGKVNPREIILHILYCVMPCVLQSFLEAQCIVSKKLEALSPLVSKAYFLG